MSRAPERQHPLAPYVDEIDSERLYTVPALATLLRMSIGAVQSMAGQGFFPGSVMVPHRRGGRRYVWSGDQLVQLARKPLRVRLDHMKYSPATLYRVGCRCEGCRQAHTAESSARLRALSDENFPAPLRGRLLTLAHAGHTVVEAAEEVGLSPHRVYGRAAWDGEFAEALDEATWSLCQATEATEAACGTAAMYRGSRQQRPCRGTACREWRRDSSRAYRSARLAVP